MFLALRDLWWARGRFALMVGAIALITLLVVMLTGLTDGLGRQSTSAITSLKADRVALATTSGTSPSFAASRITDTQLAAARSVRGVSAAEPVGISSNRITIGQDAVPVALFGADPGTQVAPAGLGTAAAVVSTDVAKGHGVKVGSTIVVGGTSLRVAALVDGASYSHQPVVWIPRSLWAQTAGGQAAGAGTLLALQTGPGFSSASFDKATGLQSNTPDDSLSAIGSYTSENGSLTLIRGLLIAISALVIGAFFTVWTVQREGDLAVLKAIGARTSYLVRDALGQALVTLLVGGGLGTLVAVGIGLAVRDSVPVVIDAATVAVPFGLMLLVGLVGAAAALKRVVTVDPLTALAGAR